LTANWRMRIITEGVDETVAMGSAIGRVLRPGCVVALYGDLGAGKTALARGIARGMGVCVPVTSPTFTVAQEYPLKEGLWLFHLDMYRIDNDESALAFGIEEYLFAADGITIIEWPERIEGLLVANTAGNVVGERGDLRRIRIAQTGENQRVFELPSGLAVDAGLSE